jgi:hypothetical protein
MTIDIDIITKILKLIESDSLSNVANEFKFEELNLDKDASSIFYKHIDYLSENEFIKVNEFGRNGSCRKYFDGGFELKEKGFNFLKTIDK